MTITITLYGLVPHEKNDHGIVEGYGRIRSLGSGGFFVNLLPPPNGGIFDGWSPGPRACRMVFPGRREKGEGGGLFAILPTSTPAMLTPLTHHHKVFEKKPADRFPKLQK